MGDLLNATAQFLKDYGYLSQTSEVKSFDDVELSSAVAKFQKFDANHQHLAQQLGLPAVVTDGQIDPVTQLVLELPRCGHSDSEVSAALGTGGWKNCHGAENHHNAIVLVNPNNMPNHLAPHFHEVLSRVQKAYADIGMLFRFCWTQNGQKRDILTDDVVEGSTNIDFTFTIGNGWIGLAIVGNGSNQTCQAKIWCQYHYPYNPSDTVTQWTTLIKHELGHNCGLGHSSGGVMNPSIVNGLPPEWSESDPSTATLKYWFSGVPVEIPGAEPDPPPDTGDKPAPGQPLSEEFRLWDGTKTRLFRGIG